MMRFSMHACIMHTVWTANEVLGRLILHWVFTRGSRGCQIDVDGVHICSLIFDLNFAFWLVVEIGNITDCRQPEWAFFQRSWTFGLGQTFWAEIFWGIWGIFGWTISTHFGTVSSLSKFSIIQPIFLQRTKPLYPTPKYLFGIWIWIWTAKNLRFSLRVSVDRG